MDKYVIYYNSRALYGGLFALHYCDILSDKYIASFRTIDALEDYCLEHGLELLPLD